MKVAVGVPPGHKTIVRDMTPDEIADLAALPKRYHVLKSDIVSRLTDEQLDAMLNAMTTRQREMWRATPTVYSDDPEILAILKSIGAESVMR